MKRQSPRVSWRLCFVLASAALLLSACGGAKKDDVIVLHVADQVHALQSVLAAAGEDKPTGYRIEWSNFLGGPAVIAAQTGGSVDIGWMAETPLVFAQAAGSPVRVVAVSKGTKEGSANIALVVPADSPIRSTADLKGKSVAYAPGTIMQYLLARALEQNGLTFDDIKSVRIAASSAAALDRNIADAVVTGEPVLTQGLEAGKFRVLAYGGQPLTPGFGYLVAANRALDDPRLVAAMGDLVTRLARATRWQRENPEKAAPTIARDFKVPVRIAEKILHRTPTRYGAIDATIIAEHQREADLFHRLGLIRARVDATKLFDHRFNPLVTAVETPQ